MTSDGDTPTGELILYQTEDGRTRIQCRFEGETVWLTQALMAELFQTTPQNITQHLREVYAEGEIEEPATCKEFLQVRTEGGRQVSRLLRFYSLEAILAVGFRVRSHRGTQFRKWANSRLSEYLVKGFTMDDERLKNPSTTIPIPISRNSSLRRCRTRCTGPHTGIPLRRSFTSASMLKSPLWACTRRARAV